MSNYRDWPVAEPVGVAGPVDGAIRGCRVATPEEGAAAEPTAGDMRVAQFVAGMAAAACLIGIPEYMF